MATSISGTPPANPPSDPPKGQRPGGPSQSSTGAETERTDQPRDDRIALTDAALRLKDILQTLDDAGVVDEARVTAIKEEIAEGRYQIDERKLAEKMTQFEEAMYGAD